MLAESYDAVWETIDGDQALQELVAGSMTLRPGSGSVIYQLSYQAVPLCPWCDYRA